MIRASCKGALLAALASAGVAWGQSASLPKEPVRPLTRVVTLQQKGGLPEQCRVLKTWTTEKGQDAWLLQTIDSEELLTAVQTASMKAGSTQVATRIYRWGNSTVPPPGSPAPPREDTAAVRPASRPAAEPELLNLAAHTVVAPETQLPPYPVPVAAVSAGSPPTLGCPPVTCDTDGTHCTYTHRQETPPSLRFLPGGCLPIRTPEHAPGYGYYPTQWRPWPGGAEPVCPPHDLPPAPMPPPALLP